MKLDRFTLAYLECLLWSTNDESTPEGGEPLDKNYDNDDFDEETLEKIIADCAKFQEENHDDIWAEDAYLGSYDFLEHAGHDFWLTRNGHGSGFWDGDWEESIGERLTAASKKFGECWPYVGDGKIYL